MTTPRVESAGSFVGGAISVSLRLTTKYGSRRPRRTVAKTFAEGVDELKKMVGSGTLEGRISVNQVYARYQDSGTGPNGKPAVEFNHPRGGQAAYLSGQIPERRVDVMSTWARSVLRGTLVPETIKIMRSFADQVMLRAPAEFDILRNSTSLRLTDDGEPVFDLPAIMPRLTETEIKAIRASARAGRTPALRRVGRLR